MVQAFRHFIAIYCYNDYCFHIFGYLYLLHTVEQRSRKAPSTVPGSPEDQILGQAGVSVDSCQCRRFDHQRLVSCLRKWLVSCGSQIRWYTDHKDMDKEVQGSAGMRFEKYPATGCLPNWLILCKKMIMFHFLLVYVEAISMMDSANRLSSGPVLRGPVGH